VSGHDVTPVSGRWDVPSVWPNPKLVKPVLSESIWCEVKVDVVGSRNGFTGLACEPWPASEPLAEGKKEEGELSLYCWTGA